MLSNRETRSFTTLTEEVDTISKSAKKFGVPKGLAWLVKDTPAQQAMVVIKFVTLPKLVGWIIEAIAGGWPRELYLVDLIGTPIGAPMVLAGMTMIRLELPSGRVITKYTKSRWYAKCLVGAFALVGAHVASGIIPGEVDAKQHLSPATLAHLFTAPLVLFVILAFRPTAWSQRKKSKAGSALVVAGASVWTAAMAFDQVTEAMKDGPVGGVVLFDWPRFWPILVSFLQHLLHGELVWGPPVVRIRLRKGEKLPRMYHIYWEVDYEDEKGATYYRRRSR